MVEVEDVSAEADGAAVVVEELSREMSLAEGSIVVDSIVRRACVALAPRLLAEQGIPRGAVARLRLTRPAALLRVLQAALPVQRRRVSFSLRACITALRTAVATTAAPSCSSC